MAPRRFLILWLGFMVLSVALLVWHGLDRLWRFHAHQQALAQQVVAGTSGEIAVMLESQRHALRLFAERERVLLERLRADPTDRDAYDGLRERVDGYFPRHLAFTLADETGAPVFGSRDRLVGPLCRQDLVAFSRAPEHSPGDIHFGLLPDGAHYDLMEPLHGANHRKSVFFVSFRIDALREILQRNQLTGHRLLILDGDDRGTVALTDAVASNRSLPLNAKDAMLADGRIRGAPWRLVDLTDLSWVGSERRRVLGESLTLMLLLGLGGWLLFWQESRRGRNVAVTDGIIEDIEGERRRIAMDMHDQVLAELSQSVRETRELLDDPKRGDEDRQRLQTLQSGLDALTSTIRATIDELHPQALDILGLEAVLRDFLERSGKSSPHWTLNAEDGVDQGLDAAQRLHLYRICLELIRNMQRHAEAEHLAIDILRDEAGELLLKVEDDGKGLSRRAGAASRGRGQSNIEVRARALGARVSWSRPRQGTGHRVELRLKVAPKVGAGCRVGSSRCTKNWVSIGQPPPRSAKKR